MVHIIFDQNVSETANIIKSKLPYLEVYDWPIDCSNEPTTSSVDLLVSNIKKTAAQSCCIVGVGGGSALDTCKAVSNLLSNPGRAEKYQGWDLVENAGVPKIGVPTLFGTGAEATRTCVLKNTETGAKLGMNSDYSYFDGLAIDPNLCLTADFKQFFYTAMDTYIHCIESLAGSYRNPLGDYYSKLALELIGEIFSSPSPRSEENLEKLAFASYFGGTAIGFSKVGLIHPFSAGLSMAFDMPHCLANCVAFLGLTDYYPQEYKVFKSYVKKFDIAFQIPDFDFRASENVLFNSTICHSVPLENALGENWNKILTKENVIERFQEMEHAVRSKSYLN